MYLERVSAEAYLKFGDNPSTLQKKIRPNVDEHQARYRFASSLAYAFPSVNSIIDGASGAGWGTHYLAENTGVGIVTGIDIDPDAITEAREYFSHAKVKYVQADLLRPDKFPHVEPADLFVSFETLEHFTQDEGIQLLRVIREHTVDNGSLTVSSPNRPLFSPYFHHEGRTWNLYHPNEYTAEEMIGVLQDNGWRVDRLYGQRFVNQQEYLRVAQSLHMIRKLALARGLPDDHLMNRVPFALLKRYAALRSDAEVYDVDEKKGLSPIYLTAVCTAV